MNLSDAIRQQGDSGTNAEVAAHFAEEIERPRAIDAKAVAEVVRSEGDDPAVWAAVAVLDGLGIDLSDARAAKAFANLTDAGKLSEKGRDAIAALGTERVTRWQLAGLDKPPSEKDVAAARKQIEADNKLAFVMNEIIHPGRAAGKTFKEIQAEIAAVK